MSDEKDLDAYIEAWRNGTVSAELQTDDSTSTPLPEGFDRTAMTFNLPNTPENPVEEKLNKVRGKLPNKKNTTEKKDNPTTETKDNTKKTSQEFRKPTNSR